MQTIRGCSRAALGALDPRPRRPPASALQVPLVVGQQEAGVLLGAPDRSAPARAGQYGVQSRSEGKQDPPPHGVHLLCGGRHPSVSGHGEATRPAHTGLCQGQCGLPHQARLKSSLGVVLGIPSKAKPTLSTDVPETPETHRPAMGTWVHSLKTECAKFSLRLEKAEHLIKSSADGSLFSSFSL